MLFINKLNKEKMRKVPEVQSKDQIKRINKRGYYNELTKQLKPDKKDKIMHKKHKIERNRI